MSFFGSVYDSDLPARCRSVYMYLKDRTNTRGECWPAISTLCRDLQLSRRTVQRALRELEADGFLSTARRHRENGSHTSSLYKILR